MDRIKHIEESVIRADSVLVEVHNIESSIILSNTNSNDKVDYTEVIKVGEKVEDIKVGDILLDVAGAISGYTIGDKSYALITRHNIVLAVRPENFDKTKKKDKKLNLKS